MRPKPGPRRGCVRPRRVRPGRPRARPPRPTPSLAALKPLPWREGARGPREKSGRRALDIGAAAPAFSQAAGTHPAPAARSAHPLCASHLPAWAPRARPGPPRQAARPGARGVRTVGLTFAHSHRLFRRRRAGATNPNHNHGEPSTFAAARLRLGALAGTDGGRPRAARGRTRCLERSLRRARRLWHALSHAFTTAVRRPRPLRDKNFG